MPETLNERVAVLETKLDTTNKSIEKLAEQVGELTTDVKKLNALIENARGAKWLAVAGFSVAAALGGMIGNAWPYIKRMWA